jgi:hypothetical protein
MPCLNEKNVLNLLKQHDIIKGSVKWDMKFIHQFSDVVNKRSPLLREKHLAYVKSLHPD